MILNQKPQLEAVYLAHFGVRGMKWGVRKKSVSPKKTGMSKTKKAALIASGAAAVAYLVSRPGGLSVPFTNDLRIFEYRMPIQRPIG